VEVKDYLALSFSSLGLIVSVLALYLGQFRRSRLAAVLGPDVHIYHPSDGGTGVYIPIIFSNHSPTRGVVYQVFLRIRSPEGMNYYLRWRREATIAEPTWEYGFEGRAKPFTVDGHSSQAKVYWFLWPDNEKQDLLFKEGKYSLTAYVWSQRIAIPDVATSEELEISREVEKILEDRRKAKDPVSRVLYLKDRGLIATATPKDDTSIVWSVEQTRP
jgi:hypothetical protein